MADFATVQDVINLYRPLDTDELRRTANLLPVISDRLRMYALKQGKDLDQMIEQIPPMANTVKSVTVDIVARTLQTPTSGAPLSQFSESALGYVASGTYAVQGGGIYIYDRELKLLGLKRQKIGVIDLYGGGPDGDDA